MVVKKKAPCLHFYTICRNPPERSIMFSDEIEHVLTRIQTHVCKPTRKLSSAWANHLQLGHSTHLHAPCIRARGCRPLGSPPSLNLPQCIPSYSVNSAHRELFVLCSHALIYAVQCSSAAMVWTGPKQDSQEFMMTVIWKFSSPVYIENIQTAIPTLQNVWIIQMSNSIYNKAWLKPS